jgi:phosphatidylglycerol---prolipoprotein diacylglyceryl transferase
MHPILFKIGNFELRSFGVMLMIAFIVSVFMAGKRGPKFGLKTEQIQDAALWLILPGILGARIMFIAIEWKTYAGNWNEIFKIQMDGLTSFGGLLGGAIGLLLYSKFKKVPMAGILDSVGVPVLIAHGIGRIGCLLNGCCHGQFCATSPPGVHVAGKPGFYYPAQLADTGIVLLGAILVFLMEKKFQLAKGVSVSLAMGTYGLSRFIYEFLRAGASSTTIGGTNFTDAHIAGLVMALVGYGCAFMLNRRGNLTQITES